MRKLSLLLAATAATRFVPLAEYDADGRCRCREEAPHRTHTAAFDSEAACLAAFAADEHEFCTYLGQGFKRGLQPQVVARTSCTPTVACQELFLMLADSRERYEKFVGSGCIVRSTRAAQSVCPASASEAKGSFSVAAVSAASASIVALVFIVIYNTHPRNAVGDASPATLPGELALYERESSTLATADMFA